MDKKMRVSEEELKLLKSLFADENDILLKEMRKYFYGKAELPKEIDSIALAVIKTLVFPELSFNMPIGQNVDLYLTLNLDSLSIEERENQIKIRNIVIEYLKNKFNLRGKEFDYDLIPEDTIELMARNLYITHIEAQLVQIKTLANRPEQIEDNKLNSNK